MERGAADWKLPKEKRLSRQYCSCTEQNENIEVEHFAVLAINVRFE